jgi:poly-beta-1,6-N-acetyl-D-glucosamine N-deacetylase PgaB
MKRIVVFFVVMIFVTSVFCAFDFKENRINIKFDSNNENSYVTHKSPSSRGVSLYSNLQNSRNYRMFYKDKAIVLTYHNINNVSLGDISIKPERFESDLKMLRDRGFNVISLRDMLNAMAGLTVMPDNAVVITFDDGLKSFYTSAYPLLLKYNMPAVNFLITSRNETYNMFNTQDDPLSPNEITEMYRSGIIDFQSHTNDSHEYVMINSDLKKGPKLIHRIYNVETKSLESVEDYEKRVSQDLMKSSEIIYKYTGKYPDTLCFPFGIYNDRIIELAKNCGYKYFVTTLQGCNRANSDNVKIYRIRAGDEKLDTNKLFNSILDIAEPKTAH